MTSGAGKTPESKHVQVYYKHAWHDYVVDANQVRFMTIVEKISSEGSDPVLENETGKWLKCSFLRESEQVGTQSQVVRIISSGE